MLIYFKYHTIQFHLVFNMKNLMVQASTPITEVIIKDFQAKPANFV